MSVLQFLFLDVASYSILFLLVVSYMLIIGKLLPNQISLGLTSLLNFKITFSVVLLNIAQGCPVWIKISTSPGFPPSSYHFFRMFLALGRIQHTLNKLLLLYQWLFSFTCYLGLMPFSWNSSFSWPWIQGFCQLKLCNISYCHSLLSYCFCVQLFVCESQEGREVILLCSQF